MADILVSRRERDPERDNRILRSRRFPGPGVGRERPLFMSDNRCECCFNEKSAYNCTDANNAVEQHDCQRMTGKDANDFIPEEWMALCFRPIRL